MTLSSLTNPVTLPQNIQEIAVTIAAKNLDPTLLSEQFLKLSGIVPNEWEAARQPVFSPGGSQIVFKNGLGIVAQPRTVTFMETMGNKPQEEILVAKIAIQFIDKLPNAEYQGLTISPKYLIPFPQNADGARQYITRTLLAPGPWQDFGQAPVQAGVNFLYQFEGCQLSLGINQATLQLPDQGNVSALLFAGNFNYPIENPDPQARLKMLHQYLNGWQSDLDTFRGIVYERFLVQRQPETVFG
jgi:hypothetical protein